MAKNAKTDTKAVRTQYDMFDEVTKNCVTAVLYTMCSMIQAFYQLQNIKKQEEENTK